MTSQHAVAARHGVMLAVGAYTLWGLMPLYLRLLNGVPAGQLLAHRVVWSLLLVGVICVVAG